MKKEDVIADSSFYICFLDCINYPEPLNIGILMDTHVKCKYDDSKKTNFRNCSTPKDNMKIQDEKIYTDKVKTNGGNSAKDHLYLINRIKSAYREIINKIESSAIQYISDGNKISIVGEPIIIKFSKPISDLKSFSNILTSSKNPFRVWGIQDFLYDDYVAINSIDLHTGDKVDFEISKEWMRIYLPKNSCGNVVVRLLTNIQHYFDSNARMIIGGEEINDF